MRGKHEASVEKYVSMTPFRKISLFLFWVENKRRIEWCSIDLITIIRRQVSVQRDEPGSHRSCYLGWCNIEDDEVSLQVNYTDGGKTSDSIYMGKSA